MLYFLCHNMQITLHWDVPSKKNSKVRTGKFLISSKAHRKRNSDQHKLRKVRKLKLPQELKAKLPFTNCHVFLDFFPSTVRLYDLSNKAETIMDFLVEIGVLADDNVSVVPKLTLKHWGKDKENPRCEILLTY